MLKNQTIEKLRDMKLKAMAQMLSEPNPSDLELSFEERLGLMVEKEWMAKKNSQDKTIAKECQSWVKCMHRGYRILIEQSYR